MGPAGYTFGLFGLSFCLYLAVAIYSKARSAADYYVAERPSQPLLQGMATGNDWISAASFISLGGVLALSGRDGTAYLMGWTGGYVLLAVLVAPYLRKYGKYTVPQFVGERYYSERARLVALLCALLVSFTYVVAQLRGVGIVLARFLELPLSTGIVLAALVTFPFVLTGGFRGITASQVAQYLVLIAAFLVPAVLSSHRLTGTYLPPLGLFGRLTPEGAALLGKSGQVGERFLSALDRLGAEWNLRPYTAGHRPRLEVLAVAATLMFGTAGLPHIVIRFFTVPKIRDARLTAAWALVFISVLYFTVPAVAAFARANLIATVNGRAHEDEPGWMRSWEKTGLVRFTGQSDDEPMRISDDKRWNNVEVDPDVLVLAHPEMAGFPPFVVGLLAAGALTAALGTAAGLALVIAAGVSHDLIRSTVLPRMSERTERWWARIVTAATLALAALLSMNASANIADIVTYAFGFAASSFFPIIVLGIFWKRASREGALCGMLVGTAFTVAYVLRFAYFDPTRGSAASWWLGISPEGAGLLGMILNFAVTILVSLATPPPPEAVQALVASLRYPREARDR